MGIDLADQLRHFSLTTCKALIHHVPKGSNGLGLLVEEVLKET